MERCSSTRSNSNRACDGFVKDSDRLSTSGENILNDNSFFHHTIALYLWYQGLHLEIMGSMTSLTYTYFLKPSLHQREPSDKGRSKEEADGKKGA